MKNFPEKLVLTPICNVLGVLYSRWKKKTLQFIIGHFDVLRNDMCAGQEEQR
jgi:hypothetical protein